MARFKEVDRNARFLPIVLEAQLQPGSLEYALDYLVGHQFDLRPLRSRYRNDETGAPNKRLDRFTLRGQRKVDTQWQLYCLVHNIERLAHNGYGG